MKALVVYDTMFGFTEKIAKAIGSGIADDVQVFRLSEIKPGYLDEVDLLVIGSPTQGGRPLKSIQEWLGNLPESSFKGKKVAVFDTRVPARWVKIFSFAAPRLADILKKKGASLVGDPAGFFVKGSKGPFVDGEENRAMEWGSKLASM